MSRSLVLLSGGLDSATVLAIAASTGSEIHALSFDYGQRHRFELSASVKVAKAAGVSSHLTVKLDSNLFRGTALVPGGVEVPDDRIIDDSIPVTYVPARNILFLSHALAYAESFDCDSIHIGANAVDYSGYPDCRPEFIESFFTMAALGMKRGVEGNPVLIHAPLIHMTKAQIILEGVRLGVDYSVTSSCYNPSSDGRPCTRCDSCHLRAKGFQEAAIPDPLLNSYGI